MYGFLPSDGIGYLAVGAPKSLPIQGNTVSMMTDVIKYLNGLMVWAIV